MQELDTPWWLEAWPLEAWAPADVRARLAAGATLWVYGAGACTLRVEAGARVSEIDVDPARASAPRTCALVLVLHRLLVAPDPVALLAALRHALAADGVCLVVEHFDARELPASARALARHLSRLAERQRTRASACEDLHRLGPPVPATPVEHVVRLARVAGFASVMMLPIEAPLLLFRLER